MVAGLLVCGGPVIGGGRRGCQLHFQPPSVHAWSMSTKSARDPIARSPRRSCAGRPPPAGAGGECRSAERLRRAAEVVARPHLPFFGHRACAMKDEGLYLSVRGDVLRDRSGVAGPVADGSGYGGSPGQRRREPGPPLAEFRSSRGSARVAAAILPACRCPSTP